MNLLGIGGTVGLLGLIGLGAGWYFTAQDRDYHELHGDNMLAAAREATHDGSLGREEAAGAIRLMGSRVDGVLAEIRTATGMPGVKLSNAAAQVKALGRNYSTVRVELDTNNQRLDAMARDLAARKADAAEWQRLLKIAVAEKRALLQMMSDGELAPSDRLTCEERMLEVEQAIDAARKAGA